MIGEEEEEYESQDEEYATVEVSWDAVILGGYTSSIYYHLSYSTVEDNELIFQLSRELPANTISTSVAVRDWYAGLEHLPVHCEQQQAFSRHSKHYRARYVATVYANFQKLLL